MFTSCFLQIQVKFQVSDLESKSSLKSLSTRVKLSLKSLVTSPSQVSCLMSHVKFREMSTIFILEVWSP